MIMGRGRKLLSEGEKLLKIAMATCSCIVEEIDNCKLVSWNVAGKFLRLNKEQCIHLADNLKKVRSMLPLAVNCQTPAAREFDRAVKRAKDLVQQCSDEKWLLIAVEVGKCWEHFVEVIMDLHWSKDVVRLGAQDIRLEHMLTNEAELLTFLRGERVEQAVLADDQSLIDMVSEIIAQTTESVPDHHLALVLKHRGCTPSWHPPDLEKYVKSFQFNISSRCSWFWKGEGSNAFVVEYQWPSYERKFALKRPLPGKEWQKFGKEAEFLEKYRHPYIVGLVGYWDIPANVSFWSKKGSIPFLLMETLDLNLRQLMDKAREARSEGGEGFSPLEAVNLMLPVAKAMRYLHSQNVCHRDLKPQNIMCKGDFADLGRNLEDVSVKLIDFGEAEENVQRIPDGGWSKAGTTLYMAPEVSERECEDLYKADVFSFALVFGEVLTWKSPLENFRCDSIGECRKRLKGKDRPTLPDDCPSYLRFIVGSCWEDDPPSRPAFQDICWMLQAAKLLLSGMILENMSKMFSYEDGDGEEHSLQP